ncbi:MAG: 6-bladed beta-propeller [Candidatus Aminicenantes bacterium]|nr:MAG: 6-bladed beta-propeller [Candidatus Aminicenantes bacterium]
MTIQQELTIGERDGWDEYLFGNVKDIAVDDSGRIFILDSKRIQIRVFDENSSYLKTIGKKGQGPGELQTPQHIFTTWQDEIMIEDHSPRQFVFYTLEGDFLRNVSFARVFIFTTGIDSGGNLIGNVQVLNRYSPELVFLHTLGYSLEGDRSTYNYFRP